MKKIIIFISTIILIFLFGNVVYANEDDLNIIVNYPVENSIVSNTALPVYIETNLDSICTYTPGILFFFNDNFGAWFYGAEIALNSIPERHIINFIYPLLWQNANFSKGRLIIGCNSSIGSFNTSTVDNLTLIDGCYSDSNCGPNGFIGTTFCSNNNVVQAFFESVCINPGAMDSFCIDDITNDYLIESCQFGCNNGQCLPPHDVGFDLGLSNSVNGIRLELENGTDILEDPAILISGLKYKVVVKTINNGDFTENVTFDGEVRDLINILISEFEHNPIDNFAAGDSSLKTKTVNFSLSPGVYNLSVEALINFDEVPQNNKVNRIIQIIGGECTPGQTRACGVTDVGACELGTQTCQADSLWGSCVGNIDPIAEICFDGLDNDCDGAIDDGCVVTTTTSTSTSSTTIPICSSCGDTSQCLTGQSCDVYPGVCIDLLGEGEADCDCNSNCQIGLYCDQDPNGPDYCCPLGSEWNGFACIGITTTSSTSSTTIVTATTSTSTSSSSSSTTRPITTSTSTSSTSSSTTRPATTSSSSSTSSSSFTTTTSSSLTSSSSSTLPQQQEQNKFYIKNSNNENVAYFGDRGNIVLKGNCFKISNCVPPVDSFIFKNSNENTVAYVDNQGNLCIETGDCQSSISCNPTINDEFIIQNENRVVSWIDLTNGNLCYIGRLTENGSP